MAAFSEDERVRREKLCKELGLGNPVRAHELIAGGARGPVEPLTLKGLTPMVLKRLGYTEIALRRLGFSSIKLQALGFTIDEDDLPKSSRGLNRPYGELHLRGATARQVDGSAETLRGLIATGARAQQLVGRGYNPEICKRAGFSASALYALDFSVDQLRGAYSLEELRRAGFGATELREYFKGKELRQNGFSAREMRVAGFRARDLMGFGYPEAEVAAAGYPAEELSGAGVSRRTVDLREFQ